MSIEASVFATRYMSAVGIAALVYDHTLTFADEVRLIWLNSAAEPVNRCGFMLNRYVTEAIAVYVAYSKPLPVLGGITRNLREQECVYKHYCGFYAHTKRNSCIIFVWIHTIAATVFTANSHFIIAARVYTLWDRRKLIKWILMGTFGIAISISMAFSILAAHQKPAALPFMLGALTAFDLFMIVLTVFNALDHPYQRQDCSTTGIVWAMCSIVTSRIQLRVEGLRFIKFVPSVEGGIELLECRPDLYGIS
ncbi:hypothetical protein B0H10DRAFT_1945878 [Mycena sp. CBHHK59/15]|nr:hypothetical protein B0H10DRAFT_1945878 [Mycena sp. CBHHK59/15]